MRDLAVFDLVPLRDQHHALSGRLVANSKNIAA
jgi:hypothetical protein